MEEEDQWKVVGSRKKVLLCFFVFCMVFSYGFFVFFFCLIMF